MTHKYLKFVKYRDLSNWSSYFLLAKNLNYIKNYPFAKIGTFLKRNKLTVNIEDDIIYKRVTIKMNSNGIYLRDTIYGKNIGTKKQFIIKKNQFLLSKIDARNGAFGVVTEEVNNAIITGNFWTFDVDYIKINPHYLTLLTGAKEFQKLSQTVSVGTTNRNYLQETDFLNLEIPLPPLEIQHQLVNAYNQKMELARQLEDKARDLEQELEEYIENILQIKKYSKSQKQGLMTLVNFSNIKRWDTEFLLGKTQSLHSKFELLSYGELIISIKNGIAARNYANSGVRFLTVSDIKNNTISNANIKYIDTYKETEKIKANTLLITRKGTVGQSVFIKEGNYTASSEVFIIEIDKNKINGNYFAEINLLNFIKNQYKEKYTGTIMPSLPQDKLKEILIPVPSLDIQNEIVEYLTQQKQEIKQLKIQAEQNIEQAKSEFENSVFIEV